MTFEDWMRHRGLSARSAQSYVGAIKGTLSKWAIDNALIAGPLTSLTSPDAFKAIDAKIRQLPEFQEHDIRGNGMYGAALRKFAEYLSEGFSNDLADDIDAIVESTDVGETEKSELVKSRIGQGKFRQRLLSHWDGCAVTGVSDPQLLVASHIKPWRFASHTERLDPYNGLLLIPNLDKVFDRGLVTFEPHGPIKISPLLSHANELGIAPTMRVTLSERHAPYMDFHRKVVFKAR
ncbi:HNH endonuclease [Viridibacterium curvum]|uniref:HNH nuclease domain-containing protein n=1 Tax=Viridibacterium curvum TaxID=1101404 RepID=A0ABP9QUI1_9RHOO